MSTKNSSPPSHAELVELRQSNIGRLFQRATRAYSELALKKLQEYGHEGLTLVHTALISNLDLEGNRTTEIAKRAGITKQAMGQLVHELETRGYVERIADPDDKRASLVQFTPKGKDLLVDAFHIKQSIESEYAKVLGKSNMGQLRDLLQQLVAAQNK